MKDKLDPEEQELLRSLENDEWESIPNLAEKKSEYEKLAHRTFQKTKRVNLRVSERDFVLAHSRALEDGIPYQTLLSSVIHKYLTGKFVEKHG